MDDSPNRILKAWLETDRRLGEFLANAAFLYGKTLNRMTDHELADASEQYRDWLKAYRPGQVPA